MKSVLFLNPFYYPGYRSGGPQRTLMNIADLFGNGENIYILTQNVDFGNSEPYEDIPVGEWLDVGKAKVKYLSPAEYGYSGIKKEYDRFDVIYSCGMFEKNSIVILLIHRLARKTGKRLYLAPMGVFSPGALRVRAVKKYAYLNMCKVLGLFKNVIWSFSSEMEKTEAVKAIGKNAIQDYIIAEDLPRKISFEHSYEYLKNYKKEVGKLRIIFLSRIVPKKNLSFCLEILNYQFPGKLEFDIYGALEDKAYWNECEEMMKKLPENIKACYCGEVMPENVVDVFRGYDVFLFPTKGENYGHVIYEALAAGCVPVISDQTPWNDMISELAGGGYASRWKICTNSAFISRRFSGWTRVHLLVAARMLYVAQRRSTVSRRAHLAIRSCSEYRPKHDVLALCCTLCKRTTAPLRGW